MLLGNDNKFYITTGDAYEPANSQDLSNLHGKVIRINTDGSIPDDNPFVRENNAVRCAAHNGTAPTGTGICSEIFAYGLRNPFRVAIDPHENDKTYFVISDVGQDLWEELDPAGTDYAGADYGFPEREGPCAYHSTVFCDAASDAENLVDPLHFYLHYKEGGRSAAVAASAFVPKTSGWPGEYSFLVSDFVHQEIYSLTEDTNKECREGCTLPKSKFKNTTFFESTGNVGDDSDAPRIVDMIFGPYKDKQALYVVRYGSSYESFPTILRIRYTGLENDPPITELDVEDRNFPMNSTVTFNALGSSDPEGDELNFRWFFGDGTTSAEPAPRHKYGKEGQYKVTLIVTDNVDQSQQQTTTVTVGNPPNVTILSPVEGQLFAVGEILQLKGVAVDINGVQLDSSLLEWSVRKHQ